MNPQVEAARQQAEAGNLQDAWRLLSGAMMDEPNDPASMLLATFILEKEGRPFLALPMCRELVKTHPEEPSAWVNLGRVLDALWQMDEALACYDRVLKRRDIAPRIRVIALVNSSAVHLQMGRFAQALPLAQAALDIEPENRKAKHNVGLCKLAAREWRAGWMNYEASLGTPQRVAYQYAGEPRWDGTPTPLLVLFGEQGLGDEINGASMIPDAMQVAGRVVVDCDRRLAGLFQRSFPQARVYGTRGQREGLPWAEADRKPTASTGVMQLGQFFRNREEDFPGTPYLEPCPVRTAGWREAKGPHRMIGVAWTGGVHVTASRYRKWTLDDLLPLFRAFPDADFVSLQYRDARAEIEAFRERHPEVRLRQHGFATLTPDYDDTAALVAACDGVFAMQTSVIHLAGALGVPAMVGVSKVTQWRYGNEGDTLPWYRSVRLFREDAEGWPIEAAVERFQAMLEGKE